MLSLVFVASAAARVRRRTQETSVTDGAVFTSEAHFYLRKAIAGRRAMAKVKERNHSSG